MSISDIAPTDIILNYIGDIFRDSISPTYGFQIIKSQRADDAALPTGPVCHIFPVRDEFGQGDLANRFRSELTIAVDAWLPTTENHENKPIRKLAWEARLLIASRLSIRPPDLVGGLWESMRMRRIDYNTFNMNQRVVDRALMTIEVRFDVVVTPAT